MSMSIDVLQELFAERERSKALEEDRNQLSTENARLRNELSSVRNDSAEIGAEGRSISENYEDTTESGVDSPECLEPQLTDAGDLYNNLQTALQDYNMRIQSDFVAANENDRELRAANEELRADNEQLRADNEQLQSQLDAACDINKELSERNGELQMARDDADKPEASDDGDYVQELENRLGEMQLELDTAHVSKQEIQEKCKLREDQLEYVAEANWENMRPFLDENLSKRLRTFRAKFNVCYSELCKVREKLSKAEANSTELREENQALREDLKTLSAASENDAQSKETSKPTAKVKMDPVDSELLRLKDRKSVHVSSGWKS